jgi:hypothetical protein
VALDETGDIRKLTSVEAPSNTKAASNAKTSSSSSTATRRLASVKAPSITKAPKNTKAPSITKAPSSSSKSKGCPVGDSTCNDDGWVCNVAPCPPARDLLPENALVSPLGSIDIEGTNTHQDEQGGSNGRRLCVRGRRLSGKGGSNKPLKLKCPSKSGKKVTLAECCPAAPERRLGEEEMDGDIQPWMSPTSVEGQYPVLVAANPGIWKIPGFLDDDLVDRLLEVVGRTGDESGLFEQCAGESHAHLVDKKCFRLKPSATTTPQDHALVVHVMEQLGALWPSQAEQRDYMYAQRTKAGCGSTKVHTDVNHHDASPATATTVLYLTSGGADVFFPHADIAVTPERGMVVTWLNIFSDGSHNYLANHGIQATPDDAPERLALSFRINLSPEELVEATDKWS